MSDSQDHKSSLSLPALVLLVCAALLAGCNPLARGQAQVKPYATARPVAGPQPTTAPELKATSEPTVIPAAPLTGRQLDDPARIRRRVVAVKLDNAPLARPQLGLAFADVVYEMLAEGGLTRFLALFHSDDAPRVGPVRSARLTDIYLAQEWDFLFAYAGAGRTTTRLLGEAIVPLFKAPELAEPLAGSPYTRDRSRPIPHNLFVEIAKVREAAAQQGHPAEMPVRAYRFSDPGPEPGPLRSVNLPYGPSPVSWRFDPASGQQRRVMSGAPHVEGLTGQQLAVENVIVLFARIFAAGNVEPDSAGNPVLDTELKGEGSLLLFRDGHVGVGKWSKEHERAPTLFLDQGGEPLALRPGTTWIHIVPTDFGINWS